MEMNLLSGQMLQLSKALNTILGFENKSVI